MGAQARRLGSLTGTPPTSLPPAAKARAMAGSLAELILRGANALGAACPWRGRWIGPIRDAFCPTICPTLRVGGRTRQALGCLGVGVSQVRCWVVVPLAVVTRAVAGVPSPPGHQAAK